MEQGYINIQFKHYKAFITTVVSAFSFLVKNPPFFCSIIYQLPLNIIPKLVPRNEEVH